MPTYDKGLSNLSYTNKDFNSIYSELLDLADRISPKWKPSQSNESDPGALMLKFDALIGDKNNYNIDKNILELFPSSVTQYPNAREIFEQCGYIMPYYQAAEVEVSLTLDNEPEVTDDALTEEGIIRLYSLDNFTTLCDADKSIVYTIVDEDAFVTSDRTTYTYKALQGSPQPYILNNSELITYNNLDYNNRIYFKESNIAENGIFIQNVRKGEPQQGLSTWQKVDNLMTEPLGTYCYKFGVSKDGSKCYLEFPSDIANIIGEGIKITYLTTSGYIGNISKNTLNSFFADAINVKVSNAGTSRSNILSRDTEVQTSLTSENVYIRNTKASTNGRDPETIEDARKNYERTKTTFETLVSLRDYNNFLLTSDQVSNGFVCDRSNDIQSTTKIISSDGNIETSHTQVRSKYVEHKGIAQDGTELTCVVTEPELKAFDLKIYALKNVYPVNNDSRFELSFQLIDSLHLTNLTSDMEQVKCLQHDFEPLLPDELAYIQLRYPIKAKIIPYNKLETLQQLEVQANIEKALYESLNASKLTFGEEIDYNYVYDVIMASDVRIKSLLLDDFEYEPYMIFENSAGMEYAIALPSELPQDKELTDIYDPNTRKTYEFLYKWMNTIKAKSILAGVTPLLESSGLNFNQSIWNTQGTLSSPVGKVNTNSELKLYLTDDTAEVTLTPNENIYLTTNNFITIETYANYVKYFYNLNTQVKKDEIHELGDGEYIVFFWKASNEDETYYYAKYSKGSIICPTFELEAGSPTTTRSSLQSSYLNLKLICNGLDNTSSKLLPTGTFENGQTRSDFVSICDENTILSGTRAISLKSTNSVTLEKGIRTYWITNDTRLNTNNEKIYVLFDANVGEYTLKSGEYFFYSDQDGRTFSMLGPGTKLKRLNPKSNTETILTSYPQLSCIARSYEEIMFGTNNLLNEDNLWVIIPSAYTLKGEEMMFYNISEGSTLRFDFSEVPSKPHYIKINNTGIKAYNVTNSLMSEGLSKAIISYKVPGSSEEYTLPQLSASSQWEGHTILNLKCSPNKEQILYNTSSDSLVRTQAIILTHKLKDDSSGVYEFEGLSGLSISPPDTNSQLILQSNYEIEVPGGTGIDITAIDMLGARYNNRFYSYTQVADVLEGEGESAIVKARKEDYKVEILLQHTEEGSYKATYDNLTINFPPLPDAEAEGSTGFLLPIITYRDYTSLSITSSGSTYRFLNQDVDAVAVSAGMYFLVFPGSTTSINCKIEATTSEETASTIVFLPITTYVNEDILKLTDPDSLGEQDLFKIIKLLDENNKFNYAHMIDNAVLIENPWAPEAFLDYNHPYNACTLCKWDYKKSTAKISNKIK